MRLFRVLIVALLSLLLAGAVAPSYAGQDARPRGSRAVPHGQWLLDPHGKVLMLHGLNMVYKHGSYAPDEAGFGADDARFLARHGFTTVRLGLIWKAVEPQPGVYDTAYIKRIRHTTQVLARHGIWTLLDFHQDLYNEKFQGEGAPDWAVLDDGLPAEPQAGFPGNYFGMPALNRAFDHFWANDEGPGQIDLQDRYAGAWAKVASTFRRTPRILGLDLFNEPWPGSQWENCANPAGCPQFDADLQDFTEKQLAAIRAVDARTAVFYEPNVLFNSGAKTSVAPTGKHLAFSFHDYCISAEAGTEGSVQEACKQADDLVWGNTAEHTAATGHAPLLTEFGATTDGPTISAMVARAARNLTGWQFWAYCGCGDPTTTGPGAEQALVLDPSKPPRGKNVDHVKLRALVVPHLQVVAGTPTRDLFHRDSRRYVATWTTATVGTKRHWAPGSRTTLFVPRSVYKKGYAVKVTGGHVVRHGRELVVAQSGRTKRIRVVVSAR
jgi:endoglycosylceramidase